MGAGICLGQDVCREEVEGAGHWGFMVVLWDCRVSCALLALEGLFSHSRILSVIPEFLLGWVEGAAGQHEWISKSVLTGVAEPNSWTDKPW